MSLHYARLKTIEELRSIMCCEKAIQGIIQFFPGIFKVENGITHSHITSKAFCRYCSKEFKDIRVNVFPDRWINSDVIDIDESPITDAI